MVPLFRQKTPEVKVSNPPKLHIGCGTEAIPGWCNVDIQDLPGVDVVLDVTEGLPFHDVEYIFCEHFIEHLRIDQALKFLSQCRQALKPAGVMRLSTPNLDWVVKTHYHPENTEPPSRIGDALMLNRAFYAWGHQFLYNAEMLHAVLQNCGFSNLEACHYGHSAHEALSGLERHEQYESVPDLPDVLVVEATSAGEPETRRDEDLEGIICSDFLSHLAWRLDS